MNAVVAVAEAKHRWTIVQPDAEQNKHDAVAHQGSNTPARTRFSLNAPPACAATFQVPDICGHASCQPHTDCTLHLACPSQLELVQHRQQQLHDLLCVSNSLAGTENLAFLSSDPCLQQQLGVSGGARAVCLSCTGSLESFSFLFRVFSPASLRRRGKKLSLPSSI